MPALGQGVSLRGIYHEDFQYTLLLNSAMTSADVGKPVSLDTTANNTVKVAADGDTIFGKLDSFEDRKVEGIKTGAVSLKGGYLFPFTATLAVGDSVVGNGAGGVKKAAAANNTVVVEISGSNAVVVIK